MDKLLSDLRVHLARRLPSHVMRAIRPFLTVQFVMFMVMGIVNTAISISAATLLDMIHVNFLAPDNAYRVFARHTNANFICGYLVSIVTSFFLNCRFTFNEKPSWSKFLKFPISYIPNFLFQYIFVFVFTSLGISRTLAYICAAVIGTPMTFAAMKLIVFKRRKATKKEENNAIKN